MSNALTAANSGEVAGGNPWAMAGAGAGTTAFMKFTGATGDFTYGQEDEELEHGTTLAADVENSKWVWSFWWDGEVLETRESFVSQNPLGFDSEPDDLPEAYDGDMSLEEIRAEQADRKSNFMDGWSCQAVLGLREIGGEGEEFTLKLNKGVALNAFRALLNTYGKQFRFKVGMVPIVELGAKSYKSKVAGVGKRYAPILKIVDWKSEEELMADSGDDPDLYEVDAAEDAVALPAPDESEAEEKPKPRGRSRRGAQNFG